MANTQRPHRAIHLDTEYLLAALDLDDPDRTEPCRRYLHRTDGQEVARVSNPVLGEFHLVLSKWVVEGRLTQEGALDADRRLYDYIIGGGLGVFGHGNPYTHASKVAASLRAKEERLRPTDALIIACAIVDPQATGLLMGDEIIRSVPIQDRMKKEGKDLRPIDGG